MTMWTIAVLGVALVAVLLIFKRLNRTGRRSSTPQDKDYHCVAIAFDDQSCCDWVRKLEGKRLLPFQARLFPLPLPECDAKTCRCRYVHFDDRRADDRRIPFGTVTPSGRFALQDRREGSDRRRPTQGHGSRFGRV